MAQGEGRERNGPEREGEAQIRLGFIFISFSLDLKTVLNIEE
jgi:hypothetical protein